MSSPVTSFFVFDEFELDTAKRLFLRNGTPVALSPKAFEVLTYLAGNSGRVIAKEELLKAVWHGPFVEENNLSQQVSALRKALGDRSGYIATIPGRGYQFTVTVVLGSGERDPPRVLLQTVHEHSHITLDELSTTTIYALPLPERRLNMSWAAASAVAVLLLATAWGGWRWSHREVSRGHHEIVLGSFENSSGEPAFDATLNTALAIDLKETPYLQIAGEGRARDTLKLMEHPPDEPLTPELAREVCQRINDQALMHGAISRFGNKYIVTLTAADCASGDEIVQTKAVADGVDGVLQAVDTAAAEMREKLGEPLSSLRRFRTPLSQKMTTSLPALKAYSLAMELIREGKPDEAIPLLKQATELDPNFASAYVQLGFANNRIGQFSEAMLNYSQAYARRDHADERDRFYIDTEYKALDGQQTDMMRMEEQWADVYPDDVTPWLSLSKQRLHLGWIEQAIEPARKAIVLDPSNAIGYEYLAEAQMRSGQTAAAKLTCQRAIALKIDGIIIHGLLLTIAFYEQDDATIAQQIAWAQGTKAEPEMRVYVGHMDLAQGKLRAEENEYRQMLKASHNQNLQERADHITARLPKDYSDVGLNQEARRVFG